MSVEIKADVNSLMSFARMQPKMVWPPQVNQFGLYGGFIGNYEEAVGVVRRCSRADVRFRTLAEVLQPPPPCCGHPG